MDTYKIKLTGVIETPQPIEMLIEYEVLIPRMNITNLNERPNEDGSYTYTYTLKPTSHLELKNKGLPTIVSKDPTKQSQKLRGRLYGISNDLGVDNEQFYQEQMSKIIRYADEVIEFLNNKQ